MQLKQKNVIDMVLVSLLEQGRGTASDGYDWMRLAAGICMTCGFVLYFGERHPNSVWMLVVTALLGAIVTATWIVMAGVRTAKHVIDHRRSSSLD